MYKIIRGFHNLPTFSQGCVATIGNFDGIHLGHQSILNQLAMKGDMLDLPTVAIMFEPQANEFFTPDVAPVRLSRCREKIEILLSYSIEHLCVLRFDQRLAHMTARNFIEHFLVDGLNARCLVVGDDFHFGKNKQGNLALLRKLSHDFGFEVINMHTLVVDQIRVSSTRIRRALKVSDLVLANKLLGRPYSMSGRVSYIDKLSIIEKIQILNIHVYQYKVPLSGVYVVALFGIEFESINGIAYVSVQSRLNGKRNLLEVYLFDFDRDIYGQYVQVHFLRKLRAEHKFFNSIILMSQIRKDYQQAKE